MTNTNTTATRYRVLVQTDDAGYVTAIASLAAFLPCPEEWTVIDEGEGDRYCHAQSNYLSSSLRTPEGVLRYRLTEGRVTRRPDLLEALAAARKEAAKAAEMRQLKNKLAATDYAVIKIAEGAASTAEYASLLADRAGWRAAIRRLEEEANA